MKKSKLIHGLKPSFKITYMLLLISFISLNFIIKSNAATIHSNDTFENWSTDNLLTKAAFFNTTPLVRTDILPFIPLETIIRRIDNGQLPSQDAVNQAFCSAIQNKNVDIFTFLHEGRNGTPFPNQQGIDDASNSR